MLSDRKQKAIAAILCTPTRKEAARQSGIPERTLRQYFEDPEFVAEYRRQFSELMEDATRRAQKATGDALQVLIDIFSDAEAKPETRIQAARVMLDYTLKLTEQTDIITKIEALEEAIKNEQQYIGAAG